jgi:hypothetical protein
MPRDKAPTQLTLLRREAEQCIRSVADEIATRNSQNKRNVLFMAVLGFDLAVLYCLVRDIRHLQRAGMRDCPVETWQKFREMLFSPGGHHSISLTFGERSRFLKFFPN